MRRTVRVFAAVGPAERLGTAIASLPAPVRRTLAQVAHRTDLRLVAGSWEDGGGGCLVANAVACVGLTHDPRTPDPRTLDLRMLDAFPQMSSRDLNTLIVAWDEATAQARATDDPAMRELLRSGLAWAGEPLSSQDPPAVPGQGSLAPAPPDDDAGADAAVVAATGV